MRDEGRARGILETHWGLMTVSFHKNPSTPLLVPIVSPFAFEASFIFIKCLSIDLLINVSCSACEPQNNQSKTRQ